MKVIVLGASGYIGFPVAQAFVRAGHIVYGQTRSTSKAKQLAVEEIIPIIGEATNIEPWQSLLATADVVVDTAGGTDLKTISATVLKGVTTAITSVRSARAPKLAYIYCSGTWVHGDDRENTVSDTTPSTNPPALVAWRLDREQEVVTSQVLNGIVVRPALLYGRSGSLLAPLFKSAYEGKVAWYGRPGGRYAMIHQDDLADLIVKAAEKSYLVKGCIFDAVNNASESVDDLLEKLVRISGAKDGYSYLEPSNAYEEALQTTSLIRPYLGRTLLGWEPRKPSLVDGLETYYASWKASEEL
jgi:nucleoside-diphosphate-sugar epimerase